jgi:ubiquinone/menaquinone biosynthesis C-methylase UbiE
MSFSEKLMEQGGKPTGSLGRLIGRLMNVGHRGAYHWGLDHVAIEPDSIILDVGCGGGKAIKLLASRAPGGKVYGIDHSPDMVNLAQKINKSLVQSGRVEIGHGSVSSLPYLDDMFDLVTAFETIQFWPNLDEDVREIQRGLKPAGVLLVVNRYPNVEEQGSEWGEFLQLGTAQEYRDCLSNAGFVDITIDDTSRSNWIAVSARKP